MIEDTAAGVEGDVACGDSEFDDLAAAVAEEVAVTEDNDAGGGDERRPVRACERSFRCLSGTRRGRSRRRTALFLRKFMNRKEKCGEPCWIRTSDLLIKSQLLYRLS